MDDYVAKPIRAGDLRAKLESLHGDTASPKPGNAEPGSTEPESANCRTPEPAAVFRPDVLMESVGESAAFARELITGFLGDLGPLVEELSGAVDAGDLGQVEFLAHRLRGSSHMLGAEALAGACRLLEEAAEIGETEHVSGLRDGVVTHAKRLRPELRSIRDNAA